MSATKKKLLIAASIVIGVLTLLVGFGFCISAIWTVKQPLQTQLLDTGLAIGTFGFIVGSAGWIAAA